MASQAPQTCDHSVRTEHGTVVVHGKDFSTYATMKQWITDHSKQIHAAVESLGVASGMISAGIAVYEVIVMRRKPR